MMVVGFESKADSLCSNFMRIKEYSAVSISAMKMKVPGDYPHHFLEVKASSMTLIDIKSYKRF